MKILTSSLFGQGILVFIISLAASFPILGFKLNGYDFEVTIDRPFKISLLIALTFLLIKSFKYLPIGDFTKKIEQKFQTSQHHFQGKNALWIGLVAALTAILPLSLKVTCFQRMSNA